jgi:CubicO group peptidase (beta-lactamase class C family)
VVSTGNEIRLQRRPDIQARLVEVLSGMPFDEFLQKRLFDPLGMKDAGFLGSTD